MGFALVISGLLAEMSNTIGWGIGIESYWGVTENWYWWQFRLMCKFGIGIGYS